jgi:hypothetical protein
MTSASLRDAGLSRLLLPPIRWPHRDLIEEIQEQSIPRFAVRDC